MKLHIPLLLLFTTVACGFGPARVRLDPVTSSSILDGDASALIQGCGSQPQVGFVYCRMQEGDAANKYLTFIAPPAQCGEKESCAYIRVWNNQSRLVWGGAIPKKKNSVDVNWQTLLSADTFQVYDRGFWTWTLQVLYVDPDGRERVSMAQGDIVLRVYRSGYLPLNNTFSDPNFIWSWLNDGYMFRMTSGLRAFTGKVVKGGEK